MSSNNRTFHARDMSRDNLRPLSAPWQSVTFLTSCDKNENLIVYDKKQHLGRSQQLDLNYRFICDHIFCNRSILSRAVLIPAHHSVGWFWVAAEGTCLQPCTVGSNMSPAAHTGGLGMTNSHYRETHYVKFRRPWSSLEFCRKGSSSDFCKRKEHSFSTAAEKFPDQLTESQFLKKDSLLSV
jgi:hypothetical protein